LYVLLLEIRKVSERRIEFIYIMRKSCDYRFDRHVELHTILSSKHVLRTEMLQVGSPRGSRNRIWIMIRKGSFRCAFRGQRRTASMRFCTRSLRLLCSLCGVAGKGLLVANHRNMRGPTL
jgi:hypothetical protein